MTLRVEKLDVRKGRTSTCRIDVLRVEDQERVAIVGPNGCGKSTLLRVIGGLEKEYTGEVELARGQAVYVHQAPYLFRGTVTSNVEFGLTVRGYSKRKRQSVAQHWVEVFGLGDVARFDPRRLSGGERRRVALARAFALEPRYLLLDEPFADLDEQGKTALIAAMDDASDSTILIATPVKLDFLPIRTIRLSSQR